MEGLSVIMAAMDWKKLQDKLDSAIAEAREMVKFGKCINCRHWLQHKEEETFLHYCGSPKMLFIAGDRKPSEFPADGAAAYGDFYTGPEFGCVNFDQMEGGK